MPSMRIIVQAPKSSSSYLQSFEEPNFEYSNDDKFNEAAENYIRFVQGANAFIAFFQAYESGRISYMHYLRYQECQNNINVLMGTVFLNLLWILIALVGISSINSRKTHKIQIYKFSLVFIGLARMIFFFGTKNVMGIQQSRGTCNPFYQNDVDFLTTMLEGSVVVVLLFLLHTTKNYIRAWERY